MGLIKFFKKLFSKKVIQMPTKKQDIIIQPQSSGYTTIEIGQKILVEPGWNAVIVAKDNILDVFSEGTHEISLAYIPKTTKALGLDKGKVVKNGATAEVVLPTKFKCDLYYVRTEYIQDRKWQSGMIRVKDKGKKRFSYSAVGTYSFQVQEPDKFVKLFLIEWAKIKPGRAIKKLDVLVSEQITDILWSKKFNGASLSQYDFGNLILKPMVYKNFRKYGVAISDIKLDNIIYPQDVKPEKFDSVSGEVVDENKQEENKETSSQPPINEEEKQIEHKEKPLIIEEEEKPFIVEEEEKQIPFKSFDENEVVCKSCGTKNPKGSKFCNQCGFMLIEEGE